MSRRRFVLVLLVVACFASGCRRDMQDQPKMKPFRTSPFFSDGLSTRPLVEGTVPRGWLRADTEFYTGKKSKAPGAAGQSAPASTATAQNPYPDDIEKFPFPITDEVLTRGEDRFKIFCSVCHGMTGDADGIVVRRGFRKPPSYYDQRLRDAPVGHFFDAVTNGWGAMPSYAAQIPVQDRWAIIAYVRELQRTRPPQPAPSPGASPAASPAAAVSTSAGGRK